MPAILNLARRACPFQNPFHLRVHVEAANIRRCPCITGRGLRLIIESCSSTSTLWRLEDHFVRAPFPTAVDELPPYSTFFI